VPGYSPNYSVGLQPFDITGVSAAVSGLMMGCKETGVTLFANCSTFSIFYYNTGFFTANFTLPGGSGENCGNSTNYEYQPTTTSALVGGPGSRMYVPVSEV